VFSINTDGGATFGSVNSPYYQIATDTAYSSAWNGKSTAASKDAVYDKISAFADDNNYLTLNVISQDDEPDVPAGKVAIWVDTNDSNRRYLISDVGGAQLKIEFQ